MTIEHQERYHAKPPHVSRGDISEFIKRYECVVANVVNGQASDFRCNWPQVGNYLTAQEMRAAIRAQQAPLGGLNDTQAPVVVPQHIPALPQHVAPPLQKTPAK